MKRIYLLTIAIFLLGSFVSQASGRTVNKINNTKALIKESDKKTKLTRDELPKAVQDVLETQFKEWTIGDIYLVSGKSEYYTIDLSKGDQKQTIKLDKDGNMVTVNIEMKGMN